MNNLQSRSCYNVRSWISACTHGLSTGDRQDMLRLLSVDELRRYGRYFSQQDRDTYLIAHAQLRMLLTNITGVNPFRWQFSRSPSGRPLIDTPKEHRKLFFSLSHTDAYAACAVSLLPNLGIDVERIVDVDVMGIAQTIFTKDVCLKLQLLHGSQRKKRFYELWTTNEALCKAHSKPLQRALFNFDQSLLNLPWQLQCFRLMPDCQASIVACSEFPVEFEFQYYNF